MSLNDLLNQLNSQYNQQYNLSYLNQLLNSNISRPIVLTGEDRIEQIDNELDIIRGIIPTPKGYKIDKNKIKSLLKERKEYIDEL